MGNLVSSVLDTESALSNDCSQDILAELNLPMDLLSTDPIDDSDIQATLNHLLHWTEWRPATVF